VGQAEQVAVAEPGALAVLHRLVGELVLRPDRVPAADGPAQRAPPAAEALDVADELEEVRADARHTREGVERRPAGRRVAEAGGRGEREQRRIVLRRAPLHRDPDDLGNGAQTVLGQAVLDHARVLAGQPLLGRVVRAALAAEDQEPVEPDPAVDGERVAACRVGGLAGERLPLRDAALAVLAEVGHGGTSSRVLEWLEERRRGRVVQTGLAELNRPP
jgi:hypothetical protein